MKKFLICTLFTLLIATTACAQICIFTCVIKDITNAGYQAIKLAELKSILTLAGEQTQLARDVQDAAKRVQEKERTFTRIIDRTSNIDDSKSRIINQVIRRFQNGNSITYRMDAEQWENTFAMGRTSKNPEYGLRMNTRSMETVTAALSTLQHIAHETEVNAQKLDELSKALATATDPEKRQSVEASLALLRTHQRTLRQALGLSETNLDASIDAIQIDAAANAVMQQRRDQKALRDYANSFNHQ